MKNLPLHLKYGLWSGLGMAIWMFFEYLMGWHHSAVGQSSALASNVIFFIGLFFSIKNTRDEIFKGDLDLKTGMLVGLQYSLLAALVIALFSFIYYQFINPSFADFWMNKGIELLKSKNKSNEEITRYINDIKAAYTPFKQFTKVLFFNLVTGALFSLIISLLLRQTIQPKQ